jgi:hypothetical protein
MLEEKSEKEMEGCTFQPETFKPKGQEQQQQRTHEQFLEDQRKFQEKVKNKTKELNEQQHSSQDVTLQPIICELSKKIIEDKMADRKNQPTHERLYDLNKEKMKKQAQNVMNGSQVIQSQARLEGVSTQEENATQPNQTEEKKKKEARPNLD